MKAFPNLQLTVSEMGQVRSINEVEHGMDLRDYFAAKAMQAIITNDNLLKQASEYHDAGSEASIAMLAYEQADAMMEARK
jgi:hypothetical protein